MLQVKKPQEMSKEDMKELIVTAAWGNLILYCKRNLRHGEIRIKIANAEPTALLDAKPNIRFDKPDTLPIQDNHK